jgi:hypothetical protein
MYNRKLKKDPWKTIALGIHEIVSIEISRAYKFYIPAQKKIFKEALKKTFIAYLVFKKERLEIPNPNRNLMGLFKTKFLLKINRLVNLFVTSLAVITITSRRILHNLVVDQVEITKFLQKAMFCCKLKKPPSSLEERRACEKMFQHLPYAGQVRLLGVQNG